MDQFVTPRAARIFGAIIAVLFLAGVTLYQARFYLSGPTINIAENVLTTEDPWIDVSFMVENTSDLTIAGRRVVPQISGLVTERIFVQPGDNTIEITALDSYGSVETDYLYITYPQ